VSVRWLSVDEARAGETASGVSVKMEHAAAQRRRPNKARRLKNADWEVDLFFIRRYDFRIVFLVSPRIRAALPA
jgi:hypothetical protein